MRQNDDRITTATISNERQAADARLKDLLESIRNGTVDLAVGGFSVGVRAPIGEDLQVISPPPLTRP